MMNLNIETESTDAHRTITIDAGPARIELTFPALAEQRVADELRTLADQIDQ